MKIIANFNIKKKYLVLFFILIVLFIIRYMNISYAYDIEQLEDGSVLVGNDIYKGYFGPNKLISSAINYYEETKDKNPFTLYKFNGFDNNFASWTYLQDNGEYAQLSQEGIIKLEIQRVIHNAKKIIDDLSDEELVLNSMYNQGSRYYFFEENLEKLGIFFAKNIVGYLIYEDNEIIYYSFEYANKKYENFDNSDDYLIKVSDYGAVVDDGIDDTEALKKAVDALKENGGGTLYFDKGTYDVSIENEFPVVDGKVQYGYYYQKAYPYNTIIDIRNIAGKVVVDLNGATLRLASNTMPGYRIFLFYNCDDVTIKNGTLLGDRLTHDYDSHEEAGYYSQYIDSHEWGYGIHIINSNTIVENINVKDFTGDGIFYIDRDIEQVTTHLIYNTEVSHCRRNGLTFEELLSVTAYKLYVHHVGDSDGVKGTAPKSGIDIESEWTGVPTKNIYFKNLKMEENTNYNVVTAKSNYTENYNISDSTLIGASVIYNAKIENSTFINNYKSTSSFNNVKVSNSEFYADAHESWINFSNNSVIDNSVIEGKYSDTTGNYLRVSNSVIKNSKISKFQGYYLYTNSDGSTRVLRHAWNLTGIKIINDYAKEWENNIFDECFIAFNVEPNENTTDYINVMKNNTIKNSTLWFHNSNLSTTVIFNNMIFDNTVMNSYSNYLKNYIHLDINDSEFNNSIFDSANQYVKNSTITLNDLNKKLHSNNSNNTYDNTTIRISNNLSSKSNFELLKFINNSKIILDNYNSDNPITNDSILDTDYTVDYLGNEILN